MLTKKEQLLPLTGIRFFLALWVVIFHQPFIDGIDWLKGYPEPLSIFIRAGYLAVGVFFALSGFILSYNYPLESRWSASKLKRFGIARFARIYPAYFAGLVLISPFVFSSVEQPVSPVKAGKVLAVAALNGALLQAWFPNIALSWNFPGWSLSAEMFFYCCFPFVGVSLWKISRRSTILIACMMLWMGSQLLPLLILTGAPALPASFARWFATSNADPFWHNLITYNPLLHLFQFCVGILIGRLYQSLRSEGSPLTGRGYYIYLPVIVLEVVSIFVYGRDGRNVTFLHDGLLLPLHGLVILGLALGGGILARFLSFRPLVLLGNASYSLYILHIPVSMWMRVIAVQAFSVKLEGIGAMALYVLVTVGLSVVFFKYVEEPANRALKNRLNLWIDPPPVREFAPPAHAGS